VLKVLWFNCTANCCRNGLVLLNENDDKVDSGTIEELKEGFSGPKGVAPTSSTVTVRRWDEFKVQYDKKGDT
jgi:hypothetical protein